MTFIKKFGAVAVIAIAMTLIVASCSSGGGGNAGGKPTVTMLVNITPNLTEKFWNDLVAPFEQQNNIDVTIQAPPAEGVKNTLPRLLASGQVPDVVQSLVPTPTLAPELVDLSGYEWATSAPLAAQASIGGKTLSAGIGYQMQSLWFYNKKAFSDAGITEPPKTTAEFDAMLAKVKAAGWNPIQGSGEWASAFSFQQGNFMSVIAKHPNWFAGMTSGELTFSQTYAGTLERYASWVENGYISKDAVGIKYADSEQQFLAGKSALYAMGSWFLASEAKAANKPEIGAFLAPAAEGAPLKLGASVASSYFVMKSSKQQEAALKLVEYLVSDKDAVATQLKVDGNFRDGVSYEMNELAKTVAGFVEGRKPDDFTPTGDGYGGLTVPSGYAAELNTQIQAMLTGATTPDKVYQSMDDWFASQRR